MKKLTWIISSVFIVFLIGQCFAVITFQKKFSTGFFDNARNIISIECTTINNHDYIIVSTGNGISITHDRSCKCGIP